MKPLHFFANVLLIGSILLVCCKKSIELTPFSWHFEVDSLLKDTASVNPVYDSLKQQFYLSETEEERIKALCQISEEVLSPVSYFMMEDAERLALLFDDQEGLADVRSRQGLFALRDQNLQLADSLFHSSLEICTEKRFPEVRLRNYLWLGEVNRIQGNLDSALVCIQAAKNLAKELNEFRRLSAVFLAEGLIFQQLQEHNLAASSWNQAMKFADLAKNNSARADVYRARADMNKILGNDIEALSNFHKSIRFASLAHNFRLLIFCHSGIADIFIKRKDIDNAQQEITTAKTFSEKLPNKTLLLNLLIKEAELDLMKGDFVNATRIIDSSIFISRKFNLKKKEAQGLAMKGNIAFQMQNDFEASECYQKALELARISGEKNVESYCLNRIGSIKLNGNNLISAQKKLEESLSIAIATKSENDIINASHSLSRIYRELGFFEQALDMFILFSETRQSTDNSQIQKKIDKLYFDNLRERDAYLSKLRTIAMNNEIANQNRIRNILIATFILLTGFFLVVLKGYIEKKKNNRLLEEKNLLIETQKAETIQSIEYARKIQESLLSTDDHLKGFLSDYFVLYKPKDIVSGDFYCTYILDDCTIIVCADCTGHGVPGAFMSILGKSLLSQIILEKNIVEPSEIFSQLSSGIIHALNQKKTSGNDGMDIALLKLRFDDNKIKAQFCGANRPLFIRQNNHIIEIKGNKGPIGGQYYDENVTFEVTDFELSKGDHIYMTTDGYLDQFGGENGKKLMKKRFMDAISSLSNKEFIHHNTILDEYFLSYKGSNEQVDDVCVVGICI
jgi:serine phosphatase RsbU (regulator of sigma subunit)